MRSTLRQVMSVLLLVLLAAAPGASFAAEQPPSPDPAVGQTQPSGDAAAPLSAEQLEQLLAPIALYPDSLLAQVLMASTYPLEVVSAARWAKANASLKGKALDAAVQQQTWDPSVKSLVAFPQVLAMMNDKLDWTQKLGDAFLAQQKDCMDAVQRLRAKAQAQGALTSSKEQVVKTKPASSGSSSQVIVIEPAQPEVVYVPTYNPTVVYGSWPYPSYPPYQWYPPGYVATTSLLSFGAGLATGYALWGDMDWGHDNVDIDINHYTNFSRRWDNNRPPHWDDRHRGPDGGNPRWNHDPNHRKGVPYHNDALERQFRGNNDARRDMERNQARQAFRGREGKSGNLPGQTALPGGGERLKRPDGPTNRRPDGPGLRSGGQSGGQRGIDRSNKAFHNLEQRSAFHGLDRGNAARLDGQRGARSAAMMRSAPGGGGFRGGDGFRGGGERARGGGGFHGGGGHGGGRLQRR